MKKIILVFICVLLVGCNIFEDDFKDDNLTTEIKRTLRNENLDSYKAIKHLDLSYRDIESLEGIEQLSNLESLNISNNRISDLQPLKNLEHLKILDVQNNLVEVLEPINGLENLEVLLIRNNPIKSLEAIQNLYGQLLTTDFLIEVTFKDENFEKYIRSILNKEVDKITFFDLEKIRTLDLSDQDVEDVSGIGYMSRLEKIVIDQAVVGLNEITNLEHLKHVEISNNSIANLDFLKNNLKINYLKLDHNGIQSIEGLSPLTKLEYLDLTYNDIDHLRALSEISSLETLLVKGNPIYDYEGMEDLLASLHTTDIFIVYFNDPQLDFAIKKQLNKESGVLTEKDLKTISNLDASGLSMTSLQGINLLENLVSLDISNNQITDLSPLQALNQLSILMASDNDLIDLQPLVYLENLEILDLKNNKISNVGPLLFLENLKYLYLEGNFIEDSHFKDDLIELVPYTDDF
jgi:internalin A